MTFHRRKAVRNTLINHIRRILRLYQASALIVSMRLAGAFAALLVNLILARLLTTEELAVALTTVSMATVATVFLTLGVDAASVRVISRRMAVGDLPEAKGYTLFSLRLVMVLGAIWFLGLWGWALLGVTEEGSYLGPRLYFIGVATPVLAWIRVLSMHTLADNRAVTSTAPLLFVLPLLLLVGVFLFALATPSLSAIDYFVIYSFCIATVAIIQELGVRPLARQLSDTRADFTKRREWLLAGFLLAVPALFTDFGRDIVSSMSVIVLPANEVAILAIALKLTAFLRFGVVAINQVFAARLGAAIARDDGAEIDRILAISTLLKIGPVAAMAAVLIVFGNQIMLLFSPEFDGSGAVLTVLTIEAVLLVLLGPSIVFISLGDRPHVLPVIALLSVFIMLGLIFLLGQHYGVIGVAWAFSLSWGLWALMGTIYVRRVQKRDVSALSAIRWALNR